MTAAERDVFIHGSTDEWLDIIAERERTEPPRPYWRGLIQRMQTTPLAMFVLSILVGLVMRKQAYESYADLPTSDSYAPLTIAVKSLAGLFLVALGVPGVWIAWRYHRKNVR